MYDTEFQTAARRRGCGRDVATAAQAPHTLRMLSRITRIAYHSQHLSFLINATVMEEAAGRGFFIIMSDLWYGAGKGLWMHHVTPESARVYGRFLGRRYARFKNLMWMHCGDRNPDARLAECARQLARAIGEAAPHQLHTAHLGLHFSFAGRADLFAGYTHSEDTGAASLPDPGLES